MRDDQLKEIQIFILHVKDVFMSYIVAVRQIFCVIFDTLVITKLSDSFEVNI